MSVTYNLTSGTFVSVDWDGNPATPSAIFSTVPADLGSVAGTGLLQPFVRIEEQDGSTAFQEGYNYDPALTGNPDEPMDVKDRQQSVDLRTVATVVKDGVTYYEFRLDTNETNSRQGELITIAKLKVYGSSQADLINLNPATNTWTDFSGNTTVTPTLAFNLDGASTDREIILNDSSQPGSGRSDMAMYIPVTAFGGARYAYVYTAFTNYDGGFEEWSYVRQAFVAAPDFTVNKTVTSVTGGVDGQVDGAGDVINYSIAVTNTGNIELTGVTVSDPLLGGTLTSYTGDDGNGQLDVGETWTYTGAYTVTQAVIDDNGGGDGDVDNTATADTAETAPKSDSEAVLIIRNPDFTVDKKVVSVTGGDNGKADSAGDVINYSVEVKNTGNVTLTGVTVNDPLLGGAMTSYTGDTDNDGKLDLNETWTYTGAYTVSQADLDDNGGGDGDIDNTATADTAETDSKDDSAAVELVRSPDFTVDKKVLSVTGGDNGKADSAGDVINYAIEVKNTGNVTLTDVTVSDPLLGGTLTSYTGDDNDNGKLDLGETWTYTGAYTVSQADLDDNGGGDGDIDNTATADTEETDSKDDSEAVELVLKPDFTVDKKVVSVTGGDEGKADSAGDIINYEIEVTNTGNVALTGVTVSDPLLGGELTDYSGDANDNGKLDVGETWTYSGAYTVSQADFDDNGGGDGDIDNTATADTAETESKDDSEAVELVLNPDFTIEKKVASITGGVAGKADGADDVINYEIEVTNTGNVALTGVTVSDPLLGGELTDYSGDANDNGKLDVGETWTYTGAYTVTQDDVNDNGGGDGDIDNTATAETDQVGPKDDSVEVELVLAPGINVVKTLDDIGGETAEGKKILVGTDLAWTYTVTNTGNVALADVVVWDDAGTGGDTSDDFQADYVSGDTDGDEKLDLDETWIFAAEGKATKGSYTNTATASGVAPSEETVDDTDTSSYFGAQARIDVEKYVSVDGGQSWQDADLPTGPGLMNSMYNPPQFKFVVTNTGNVALSDVTLTDNVFKIDNNGTPGVTSDDDYTIDIGTLAAGASQTYYFTAAWQQGQHANTARAEGSYTDEVGQEASPFDTDMAHYFGVQGPGVRTPGFWGQRTWQDFWDGDAGVPNQAGNKGFAAFDVVFNAYNGDTGALLAGGVAGAFDPVGNVKRAGILVGDFNLNGVQDNGEQTLFYTTSEALNIINASNNVMGADARVILDRSLLATWLNFMAGNPIDGPTSGPDSTKIDARDAIQWGIRWLQQTTADENGDLRGDGAISGTKVAASSAAWNIGIDNARAIYGGDVNTTATVYAPGQEPQFNPLLDTPAGNVIHGWLDEYNNTGSIKGLVIAFDADTII